MNETRTYGDHPRMLPMAGLTHGNRSAVTCHLRCGDACFVEAPNTTETSYFRDVAATALSAAAAVLGAGAAATALGVVATVAGRTLATRGRPPADTATATRPRRSAIHRDRAGRHDRGRRDRPAWLPVGPDHPLGRPDPEGGAGLRRRRTSRREAQAGQFGYNNDYLDIIVTNRAGTRALLVCNHEYTNEGIMFPPGMDPERADPHRLGGPRHGRRRAQASSARGHVWRYVRGARVNRRITLDTTFAVDGPAAGSDLLKTAADPRGAACAAP